MGTPAYMSPSMAQAASGHRPPHDIYAVGVILYGLATARSPLRGNTVSRRSKRWLHMEPVRPHAN